MVCSPCDDFAAFIRGPELAAAVVRASDRLEPLWREEVPLSRAIAHDGRRADFRRGRQAARRALALLGCEAGGLGRRASGAPVFPAGTVGSIAHITDLAVAIAAQSSRFGSVGVDVENLDEAAAHQIAPLLPRDERSALQAVGMSETAATLTGFCLREALFKALSDPLGRWVDHTEVRFVKGPGAVMCPRAVDPAIAPALAGAEGRVLVTGLHVYAVFLVPSASRTG